MSVRKKEPGIPVDAAGVSRPGIGVFPVLLVVAAVLNAIVTSLELVNFPGSNLYDSGARAIDCLGRFIEDTF